MNRKAVFLILGLLAGLNTTLRAQDLLNIHAGVGPSFGVGNFASQDMNDSTSGFAGIGGIINLHVGAKPTKNFGFCFFGALAMYPAKTKNVETTVNTTFGTQINATSSYYRFGIATGGLMFSGRVSNFFVLDSRLTAGYIWAETPTIEMKQNDIIYYKHYRAPGGGVAATAAFGFRWIFRRIGYLTGSVDFIFGYPRFENTIVETRTGILNTTRQYSYHQFVGAINVTGGIGISF